MKTLLHFLELIFTFAGVVVILIVTACFTPARASHWEVAAITATLVGIIHGLLFWFIRRRQRAERRAAIAEVQRMLHEQVGRQLALIQAMADLREANPAEAQRACEYISRSVETISAALDRVSEESLSGWRERLAAQRARRAASTS